MANSRLDAVTQHYYTALLHSTVVEHCYSALLWSTITDHCYRALVRSAVIQQCQAVQRRQRCEPFLACGEVGQGLGKPGVIVQEMVKVEEIIVAYRLADMRFVQLSW